MDALSPTEHTSQLAAFQQRVYFFARDPGEVAGDGMLDGTGGDAVIEALLHVAVQESVLGL